jgi:hypothetical protein
MSADMHSEIRPLSEAELEAVNGGAQSVGAWAVLTVVTALTANPGLGLMAEGTYTLLGGK